MLERLRLRLPREYFDLAQVMGGTLTRNGLRGVFKLLIAGFLAPSAMGVLRAVFSLFKLVSSLADLGLGYAMITFVAPTARSGQADEREQVLKTVLVLYLVIAGIVLVLGNLAAPWLAVRVFSDPALEPWVRLAFLAVGGQLLWSYLEAYLAAHQQFDRLAVFLGTVPIVMLATFVVLLALGRFTLGAAIVIHLFAPLVSALLWWRVVDRRILARPLARSGLLGRILRFSRWVYVSRTISTARGKLNPLLLKNAALSGSVAQGATSAGLYGFGNDLANEITVVSQSLASVLLPKAAAATGPGELRAFLRRGIVNVAVLIVPCALLAPLAGPLLRVLGRLLPGFLEYLPALDVFTVLYFGALLSVAVIPMQAVLYAIRKPHVETWVEVGTLPVLVFGAVWLIPTHGALGAAFAVLAQRVLSLVAMLVCGLSLLARTAEEGGP